MWWRLADFFLVRRRFGALRYFALVLSSYAIFSGLLFLVFWIVLGWPGKSTPELYGPLPTPAGLWQLGVVLLLGGTSALVAVYATADRAAGPGRTERPVVDRWWTLGAVVVLWTVAATSTGAAVDSELRPMPLILAPLVTMGLLVPYARERRTG